MRPARRAPLPCALAALLIAALLTSAAPAGAGGERHEVALGAYVGSLEHLSGLRRYSHIVGRPPAIIATYRQWPTQPFGHHELSRIWHAGAVPLITWEPWTLRGRPFPLRAIAAGRHDRYIRRSAREAAAWGHPLLLRFAHEMNGTWYPWGRGSVSPRTYKAAWRHVVGIFRAVGASNVRWVWTANVDNGGRFPFAAFYPGDRWVDWVGLDGFNWGGRGGWQWFGEVFDRSYRTLARISSRPVIIAETGSAEHGGSKARWVRRALGRELPRLARVRALVWFDQPFNGLNVRVNSSPAALRALRVAMRAPIYGLAGAALVRELAATPAL